MDWISEHPDLLSSIIARSSGAIGELLVARKLKEMGYKARPARINARQCDLLVTSPNGYEFAIEVKTVTGKGSPYLVRQCPDETKSSIWVFVHANREQGEFPKENNVTYRILTTKEAEALWHNRNPEPLSSAPDIKWKDLDAGKLGGDKYLDRWDKLPG